MENVFLLRAQTKQIEDMIDDTFSKGIPSSILASDHYLILFLINICLVARGNLDIMLAGVYFTIYFSITVQGVTAALIETQGILGSFDIGSNRLRSACLRLKQSLVVGSLFFIVLALIPAFFYSVFLENVVGVRKELADLSQKMVLFGLPGIGIKMLNEGFKTFIQNHRKHIELSYTYVVLLIFSIFGVCYLINFSKVSVETSVGIIFFVYELCGLISCLGWLLPLYYKDKLDFSLVLKLEIFLFSRVFTEFFLKNFPILLVLEFQKYIIFMVGSDFQLVVYSLLSTLFFLNKTISGGFMTEVNSRIPNAVDQENYEKLQKYLSFFKTFFLLFSFIFSIFHLLIILVLNYFGAFGPEDSDIRQFVDFSVFPLAFKCFSDFYTGFEIAALTSMGKTNFAKFVNIVPYLAYGLASYVIGIYLNFQFRGIIVFEAFLSFLIIFVLDAFLDGDLYVKKLKGEY